MNRSRAEQIRNMFKILQNKKSNLMSQILRLSIDPAENGLNQTANKKMKNTYNLINLDW